MFLEVKKGIWISRWWAERITVVQVIGSDTTRDMYGVQITFDVVGAQTRGQYLELYAGTPTPEAAHVKAAFLIRELERFIRGEEVVLIKDSD